MTKKDYIALAATLSQSKPEKTGELNDDYILLKHWNITVENIAFVLAKDNPLFNRNKFMKACTYSD